METLAPPDHFGSIAVALESRGWRAALDHIGVHFWLDEPVSGGVIRVTLTFEPDRLCYPPIATHRVVSGEPKEFTLHRMGSILCYIDPELIELDPDSPAYLGNIVYLADRAISELHRLQKGEDIGLEDSEFPVHWAGHIAYLDIPDAQWPPDVQTRLEMSYFERPANLDANDLIVVAIPDGDSEARHSGQRRSARKKLVPHVLVQLADYPFKTWSDSAPRNLAEFNVWLKAHHPQHARAFWRGLANAVVDKHGRESNVLILVDTAAGRLGVLVKPHRGAFRGQRRGLALASVLQGCNPQTRSIKIARFEFERLDSDFVLARNSPTNAAPLAGKKIDLIGAGTIGGHLADLLVQAGAGTAGGALRILDGQRLKSENLGRHILGISALGLNKAVALAGYLKRERLAENVSGLSALAGDTSIHDGADLVIDATASASLGAQLSKVAKRSREWSILSVSVEGDGWYAACHLYRGVAGEACRSCLEPWIGGEGSYVATMEDVTRRATACGELYTPYRASASATAAALASELACDWADERPHPLYRVVAMPSAPKSGKPARYSSPKSKSSCTCALERSSG